MPPLLTNLKNSFLKAVALIIIVALCLCALTACSKNEDSGDTEYSLYIKSVEYGDDGETLTVRVGLSATPRALNGIAAERTYALNRVDYWWNEVENTFTFDGTALYGAVNAAVTPDEREFDGVTYSHLKIVFDYVTIYKSTESQGTVTRSGKNYIHTFNVNDGETACTLTRKTPYTAAWYATLAVVGVVLAAALCFILSRGHYGGRKNER